MNTGRLEGTDWHFRSDAPPSFGCNGCFLRSICGGLRVKGAAFDCQRFCCHKKDCQIVCFNAPANYAKRLKEISGFELDNIPRCEPVKFNRMRGYAPLIHHAYSRRDVFYSEMIALSLYELLDKEGAPKYLSLEDISKNFRISVDAKLLISGVHQDRMLERVWSSTHRNSVVAMLKSIGTVILTAPNFSVYNNVPRPENLYNIKRIALLSREFLAAGVPTALHVNASTDSDYDQFGEFLSARSEFQAISFEFITGPGYPSRQWWHVRKLIELQNKLGRQVQLVLRGGTTALRALSAAFADIVVIDSDPLHRALHRQRMIFGNDGHIKSVRNHLPQGIPVDELLIQNVMAAKLEIDYALRHPNMNIARNIWRKKLRSAGNRHDESRQLDFLANSTSGEARAGSADAERMVAASKSEGAAEIQKTSKEVTKSAAVSGGSSKSRSPVG